MNDTKFTKGPWKVKPEELQRSYIRIRGGLLGSRYKIANVLGICTDGEDYDDADEVRANAHLIAAAPELYEMVDILYREAHPQIIGSPRAKEVADLLAKARGES